MLHRRKTSGRRTQRDPCAPCCHSALYRIDQGYPQAQYQAVAGHRRRRASRELNSSVKEAGRAEIDTKSPAISMFWRALSRQKLIEAMLARYGHISGSRGTSSEAQAAFARHSYFRLFDQTDERCSLLKPDTRRAGRELDPPHFFRVSGRIYFR